MRKIGLLSLFAVVSSAAWAQGTLGLYFPSRSIADQGITVKGWGSGSISETDEVALEGTTSIRISTRNYFQGGRMMFAKPIDVSKAYADRNNLLLFAMMIPDANVTMGGGGGGIGGKGGGGGLGDPGLSTGAGAGGGAGSTGGQGAPGGGKGGGSQPSGAGSAKSLTSAPMRSIRVILTTTDGKKSEAYIAVATGASGKRGWRTIGVPLQAISGLGNTDMKIKEIDLSGDSTATFYLGELKVVNDSTPLYGEPNVREINLALGDEFVLSATGSGGSSVLRYVWDFDSKDGIQVDAEGQSIKRKFRQPGTFTITMTIEDAYGLKKPFSVPIKVVVNP